MSEKSKPADATAESPAGNAPGPANSRAPEVQSAEESEAEAGGASAEAAVQKSKKKKKAKRKKGKDVAADSASGHSDAKTAVAGLSPQQIAELVQLNPALGQELAAESASGDGEASGEAAPLDTSRAMDALKRLNLEDIMTGLASSGKNVKDMASYKFWSTQPVMKFGDSDSKTVVEGPLRDQKIEDIPTEPTPLGIQGFNWETMDLTQETQLKEVYDLLNGHYVEDDDAMFRFRYSTSLIKWGLMSPGWKKHWHLGIRVGRSLCAFISAVPVQIRIRDNVVKGSEVNFMVVHKKLRNRRLAPVLIKEITRLCNLDGVFQAIHTAGVVLPKPISTCRYFHRAINWQKLYDVGFSPLPPNSKPAYQIRKYALPDNTATRGLREMQPRDVPAVQKLLKRYLDLFQLTPEFDEKEVEHWLLDPDNKDGEQVVWTYVVEDANKKITDFFSFYCLESSVINHPKHQAVRAAYLFYYATETGLSTPFNKSATKTRLNALMSDALILAKQYKFDVFNALSLMHNGLFLEQQKFGPGDGQLHYYVFNYRANPVAGGVNKKNRLDEDALSGVGFVML